MLERGEKIDRLVVKTEDLDNQVSCPPPPCVSSFTAFLSLSHSVLLPILGIQAVRFKKSSTVLKRAMYAHAHHAAAASDPMMFSRYSSNAMHCAHAFAGGGATQSSWLSWVSSVMVPLWCRWCCCCAYCALIIHPNFRNNICRAALYYHRKQLRRRHVPPLQVAAVKLSSLLCV